MKKQINKVICFLALFCLLQAGAAGCSAVGTSGTEQKEQTVTSPAKADSLDQEAIIVSIDEAKSSITFRNMEIGRDYTLSYNGLTSFQNTYDEELVISQLQSGDIVETTFVKSEKMARMVRLHKMAFTSEGVTEFEINKTAKTMSYGGKQYSLDENLLVTADGQIVDLMDINSADTLRINGMDHMVESICVEKGHGYIRLQGDEYFIGGWIEVGKNIIKPISEDMLLVVPEGDYEVLVSNKGYGGTKQATVARNKETIIDISDLKSGEVKSGKILFTISPSDAVLYLDGTMVDHGEAVSLEYGIHQMVCKADGYETLSQYIKVGQALANIDVEMETSDGKDDEDSVSGNTISASGEYKVYIDAPEEAELYVDGSYVGIIPVSFPKESGSHTISIRKTGYQTRSYSLRINDENKDVTYSFSELQTTKEQEN